MKNRRYRNYIVVIAYVMLLRIVLDITVGISVFNFGMIYDVVLMMFWVGLFALLMRGKTSQKIYYIVIVLIATVFVVGDSVYYDYFEVISSKSSLGGLKWLQEGNTLEYDIQIPLVAYLISPLLITVITLIIANKKKDVLFFKDFGFLSILFVFQVGLFLFWGNQTFETRLEYYRSDAYLFESMHDRRLYSEKYGYYNYHLLDLTRIRPELDKEELFEEVDAYFEENEYVHEENDYSDIYAGYNVVTILGETLETRFIDPILTPNLYEMKMNGLSFDNYYTTVFQQGATCNSEYMSMNGLGAITTNDWSNNICDSYSENTFSYSLPNQLEDIGYDTYYFHSGYEWFYNRETVIPSYGFDTVKFQEDMFDNHPDFFDRFDTEMIYFVEDYVDYTNPVHINMLTYSGHGAYNQEEFFKYDDIVNEAYPNVDLDPEIRNFMQKTIEFDQMLGLLKEELAVNGELDNTLFVIYPDHYPYMMNYDTYTDFIGVKDDSHEIMRQSLIIYTTGMTGEVIHTTGSTIDITPTILNLVNSDADFSHYIGRDLLSMEENYVIFSDLTISDGKNVLFLDETLIGDEEMREILETALEKKINAVEIEKKLLNSDYFKQKLPTN